MASGLQPVERDSRGILDPWLLRQRVRLTRYPAGPMLAGLVDRFACAASASYAQPQAAR